jgi:hypothetical protein
VRWFTLFEKNLLVFYNNYGSVKIYINERDNEMKKSLWILSMVFLTIVGMPCVNAQVNNKTYQADGKTLTYEEFKQTLCNTDVGTVEFSSPLKVGKTNVELYCTFTDRNLALNEMAVKYSNGISFLKEYINLPEQITSSNWNDFRNAINSIYEMNIDISQKISYELSMIDSFFDIYENNEINAQITSLVNKYSSLSSTRQASLSGNSILNELDEIIPTYSDNFGTIASLQSTSSNIVPMVGASLNVARATQYATTYATSPNTSSYYYFSNGDCTNFTSQILEYSGVSQVVYDSVYSGWWHKVSTDWLGNKTHTHSRSWTMADTFARYMGVTVSSTNLETFSAGLAQGDFIGLDKTNDGSWDHLGYVTETNGVLHMYDDPDLGICIRYYNFKVAQHTSNYHLWVSNSGNSWETYTNGRYARIRG